MVSGRVSIWESTSGRCLHNLEGPGESIEWVNWHPRGDVVLAGSEDFTAWMWNAQSGDMMQVSRANGKSYQALWQKHLPLLGRKYAANNQSSALTGCLFAIFEQSLQYMCQSC